MARRWIEIARIAAFAGAAGCSGETVDAQCQSACQRVVSCSGNGYGYSFNFAYAYSLGSGFGYYGSIDLQQCLSDCAAVAQPDRSRIAQCVISAADCMKLLNCP